MRIKHTTLSLFIFSLFALLISGGQALADNVPDPSVLLLGNGRFTVTVDYANFQGNEFSLQPSSANGSGLAVQLTDDTGYFYFPNARGTRNVDLIIKLLNGCPVNSRFWVFSAATTNFDWTMTVTDTVTNQIKTYSNPAGTFSPAITDTDAFDGCSPVTPPQAEDADAGVRKISGNPLKSLPAPGSCTSDDTSLCLLQNRFRVQVEWEVFNGDTGQGHAIPIAETDGSGLFWMFSDQNFEMVVKMIDGSSSNGYFWVFIGAMTDIKYTVIITDTVTNKVQRYDNPLGSAPDGVGDNKAFSNSPSSWTTQRIIIPYGNTSRASGDWIGLAVNNQSSSAQSFNFSVYNEIGVKVATRNCVVIPSMGIKADMLENFFTTKVTGRMSIYIETNGASNDRFEATMFMGNNGTKNPGFDFQTYRSEAYTSSDFVFCKP